MHVHTNVNIIHLLQRNMKIDVARKLWQIFPLLHLLISHEIYFNFIPKSWAIIKASFITYK